MKSSSVLRVGVASTKSIMPNEWWIKLTGFSGCFSSGASEPDGTMDVLEAGLINPYKPQPESNHSPGTTRRNQSKHVPGN